GHLARPARAHRQEHPQNHPSTTPATRRDDQCRRTRTHCQHPARRRSQRNPQTARKPRALKWHESGQRNPVYKMCLWLAVSTSGFYDWLSRRQSPTAARRQALAARVRHFFEASDGTYGYRRIHADLADEGTECSAELVRQIMRDEAL